MLKKDSISISKDSLNLDKNIQITATDSTKVDTLKTPKEFLEDIIKKKSDDYISNDFINKRATLL